MQKKEEAFGKRKIRLTTTIIISFITLVAGIALGQNWDNIIGNYGPYLGGKKHSSSSLDFSSVQAVYNKAQQKFDGDIDREKIITGAKRGLIEALGDKYTYYMTKSEYDEFISDLNGDVGAGIGVEIGERDSYVKVLRTTPDNPAQKAGILAGDIIYKVDGKDVSEKSSEDVAKLIRGPEGSEVKITVVRNKEEKEFNLKREKINNVSAFVDYKDKTAILTIRRFDTDTGNLVKKIAQEIKTKKCDKIVLDLRDNGGGYVDSAKQVASFWIDDDVVVLQKSQNGVYNETTYTSSGQATLKGIKTNVLINGNTASAAEILAGALRDYDLAVLIGEKTYGKGSVQELAPVDNVGGNDYLRVTIAKWYTPKGKNINKDGIKPDKEVKRSFEQINKDEDPQLEAALKD
ncbi:S41 family peptidase [Candidatus Saccharibacteria bacterium]|nr:S41 family peptidase [Candidatus Saccharibacteria bacterium]